MERTVRIYEILVDEEAGSPIADAEERRLTTAAKVNAALGQDENADAELLESIIDQVSGECVRFCGIARPYTGVAVPTFGREVIRVTWLPLTYCGSTRTTRDRGSVLRLPWRVPVVSVDSVTEDGIELAESTDFRSGGAATLLRVSDDVPICWSSAKIIAELTVGWDLPDGVPAELEGRVIEQVKMVYLSKSRDPGVLSESVPDVYQASYGDSRSWIGESGLLKSLEVALTPFRSFGA